MSGCPAMTTKRAPNARLWATSWPTSARPESTRDKPDSAWFLASPGGVNTENNFGFHGLGRPPQFEICLRDGPRDGRLLAEFLSYHFPVAIHMSGPQSRL